MGEAQGANGYQHEQSVTRHPHPATALPADRRDATAALLGAHSVMAGRLPGSGAAQSADALGPDAIDTLAGALDFDLERIFRFVADRIWYEPYGGLLRGASGTLESRAGNSVDKAVLLDALLRASFLDTRFVEGALDPAAESTILDSVVVTRDVARTRAAAVDDRAAARWHSAAAATGPLPPELQEIADLAPELSAAATSWIAEHLDANVATIVQALGDAGIELGTAAHALPVLERDRHVWLQVKQGSDWIDLDPTIAGTQLGDGRRRTGGGASYGSPGRPPTPDPDSRSSRMSSAATRWPSDRSSPTRCSRTTIGTAPIVLLHEKPDGLKGLGITIGAALGGAGDPSYQAILDLGDDVVVGETWLSMRPGDGGVFGTGSSGREGVTVAEWLDVSVTAPDGTARAVRRPVFDLVDATARAGGIDRRGGHCRASAGVVHVSRTRRVPAVAEPVVPVRRDRRDQPRWARWRGDPDDEVAGVGLNAALYHLARDEASAVHSLDRGVRTFLDGPNIAAYVVGADLIDDATFVVSTRTDLLQRALGTLPVADRRPTAPPGVVAGVLGHLIERVQSGEGFAGLLPATGPVPVPVSAGGIIESAIDQGIGLRVLRGSVPQDLAIPGLRRDAPGSIARRRLGGHRTRGTRDHRRSGAYRLVARRSGDRDDTRPARRWRWRGIRRLRQEVAEHRPYGPDVVLPGAGRGGTTPPHPRPHPWPSPGRSHRRRRRRCDPSARLPLTHRPRRNGTRVLYWPTHR